jgi:hypothetical protein
VIARASGGDVEIKRGFAAVSAPEP